MLINFTKMHGLGNDFVVIDAITQPAKLRVSEIKQLCDRHLGVGCDQLLIIEPPTKQNSDCFYRIFNANGQEAEQCGNEIRCVVRFFYDMGFTNQKTLTVDCLAGSFHCRLEENGLITINMGTPVFAPKAIPLKADKSALTYTLNVDNQDFEAGIVGFGNPHAIIHISKLKTNTLQRLGPLLSEHIMFPKGANIGFMEILDPQQIRLQVWERGVGPTLACGSNACAAVVSGIRLNQLKSPCQVLFPKGELTIRWDGDKQPVWMSGPARSVFTGRFRIN